MESCGVVFRNNVINNAAHTIASRPNFQPWLMNHISDLIMLIRWSTNISHHQKETGSADNSPSIYFIKNNNEIRLRLKYTLSRVCMASILYAKCFQTIMLDVLTRGNDFRVIKYPINYPNPH